MTTTKEGWEQRFDEKFTIGQTYWRPEKEWHSYGNQTQPDAIKAFITSEITKAQVEVLDDVEGVAARTPSSDYDVARIRLAIDRIRALITDIK